MKRSIIPKSVREARITRAHIARFEPFDVMYRTIEDAWIVVDSSWRAKLGGAAQCAVCNKALTLGRRDLCRHHAGYEFLLIHHSDSPHEQRQAAVRRLRPSPALTKTTYPRQKEEPRSGRSSGRSNAEAGHNRLGGRWQSRIPRIPFGVAIWGCSSVGRALRSQ